MLPIFGGNKAGYYQEITVDRKIQKTFPTGSASRSGQQQEHNTNRTEDTVKTPACPKPCQKDVILSPFPDRRHEDYIQTSEIREGTPAVCKKIVTGRIVKRYRMQRLVQDALGFSRKTLIIEQHRCLLREKNQNIFVSTLYFV